MISQSKIAIIGAGAVGATTAYTATLKNLAAEILLIDVNETKEEGEVMDIADGLCLVETGCVKGADFKDARDVDIIVITAGAPQKPGETRLDLVKKNTEIQKSIFKQIGKLKSTAIIIMVANPVDVLALVAQKLSGLPRQQVFGSGTTLDTTRFKATLAKKLKVSPQSVHGYVLGEHGDSEFVAWSTVTVGGVPVDKIKEITAKDKIEIEKKVKKEAYEIINRKGATFYGIALVLSDIIEAILYNQHKIMPISSMLLECQGVNNVCLGMPAVLGRGGVEKIWPLQLNAKEKKKLQNSAKVLKQYLS
ncbi:MAG: L-lactate dehydrogenase [Candidatus Magasanikbacteria bacterium]|nr:L-lactate dehydrogenase [Candidatus Magasanikbacteria bacterium]